MAKAVPIKIPVEASKPKPVFQPAPKIRSDLVEQEPAFRHASIFHDQVVKPFERIKKDAILYMHKIRDFAVPSGIECSLSMLNSWIQQDPLKWSLEEGTRQLRIMSPELFALQKYIIGCNGYTADVDSSTIDLINIALCTANEVATKLRKVLDKHSYESMMDCVSVYDALSRTIVPRLTKDKLLALIGQYNKLSEDIDGVVFKLDMFAAAPVPCDVKNLQLGLDHIDAVAPLRKFMISRISDRFPRDYNFDQHDDEFIHMLFSAIHKTVA